MDVRGVLRRTRLSLVASLFLALLGGAGVAATAGEPVPVPVTTTVAAPAVAPDVAAPFADAGSPSSFATPPATGPGVAAPVPVLLPDADAGVAARITRLTSQVSAAAAGPRAPPATA